MSTVTPVKAWPDRTGKLHATIEEWRRSELEALVRADWQLRRDTQAVASDAYMPPDVANFIVYQADAIIATLTTGPRSRPKARRVAGTTNPKRAAKRATPAQVAVADLVAAHTGTNATKDADVPAEPVSS